MIQIRLGHLFVTQRKVCAPSIVFVDSGRPRHPITRQRITSCCALVSYHIPVAAIAADTAAAAAAASAAHRVVFPRRCLTQRSKRIQKLSCEPRPCHACDLLVTVRRRSIGNRNRLLLQFAARCRATTNVLHRLPFELMELT